MSQVFEGRNEQLIKLVRTHPELYDPKHGRYHSATHKTKVWNTIGALMEEDGLVCKSRWKNIRDQYRKNVKKHGTKTPPYRFSEHLSFLKEYTDCNEIDEQSSQSAQDSDQDDFINELFNDSKPLKDSNGALKKSTPRITRRIKRPVRNRLSTKPVITNTTSTPRVMEFLLQKLEATQNPNSVDVFLAGIAPALKILSPYDWIQAKLEIFSIVHKYELKMLTDPSPMYCPDRQPPVV